MSIQASRIVRWMCALLPGVFFLFPWRWQLVVARERLPLRYKDTTPDEIVGMIVLLWTLWVVWRMRREWQMPLAEGYRTALRSMIIQQAICLFFCSLMLDGGLAVMAWILCAMLFWMVFGLIVSRRAAQPTGGDLDAIRYTFVPLLFLVTTVTYCYNYGPHKIS